MYFTLCHILNPYPFALHICPVIALYVRLMLHIMSLEMEDAVKKYTKCISRASNAASVEFISYQLALK